MLKAIKEFLDIASGVDGREEVATSARVIGLVTFPFRFMVRFIGFLLTSWASSRPGFAFVRGLPAICAGGGFIASLIGASFLLETRNVKRYEGLYGYELTKTEDFKMASSYAEKLMGFYPDNPQYHYNLGLARYLDGDSLGAFDVMENIGVKGLPVKSAEGELVLTPFPPAIVWLAKTTISDTQREPSLDERVKQSEVYYKQAIGMLVPDEKNNFENDEDLKAYIEANVGLARIREYRGDTQGAITYYQNIVKDGMALRTGDQLTAIPSLVRLFRDSGDKPKAKQFMESVRGQIEKIANNQPDNVGFWNVIVNSYEMLEDYELAEKTIDDAVKLASNRNSRSQIKALKSRVFLNKAKSIKDVSQAEAYTDRLAALSLAVTSNPRTPAPYGELVKYVWSAEENPEHDKWLKRSFVNSEDRKLNQREYPAIAHMIIGLRDIRSGNVAEGHRHWLIANKQLDSYQDILNLFLEIGFGQQLNFKTLPATASWLVYSHQNGFSQIPLTWLSNEMVKDKKDLMQMLDTVSVAIETFPNQLDFYTTRGKLYQYDEQYAEAVADYNHALKESPQSIRLRALLVRAYTGMGDTESAEINQKELERLQEELAEARAAQAAQAAKGT